MTVKLIHWTKLLVFFKKKFFSELTRVEIDGKFVVDVSFRNGINEFAPVRTFGIDCDDGRVEGAVFGNTGDVERLVEDGCGLIHHRDGYNDRRLQRRLSCEGGSGISDRDRENTLEF